MNEVENLYFENAMEFEIYIKLNNKKSNVIVYCWKTKYFCCASTQLGKLTNYVSGKYADI